MPVIETEAGVFADTVIGRRIEDTLLIIGFPEWKPEDFDAVVTHFGLTEQWADDWQHSTMPTFTGGIMDIWLVKIT